MAGFAGEVSITGLGVEVPRSAPGVEALVRRQLSVAPLALNDPWPKRFKVFLERPDRLVVPLHWAREALPRARFRDARPPPAPANLRFAGALREDLRQPEAVEAVRWSWDACGGAMLCIPPGTGKTCCALYLAAGLGHKTLVLVHKAFLKDQWIERVRHFLPGARVTEVQGERCDTSGDVVVAMIQTLVSREYPPSAFAGFGLVIVDEVHHLGAQAFSRSMWGLCAPRVLGLSATPDRKDGLSRVVSWFVGPVALRVRREGQASTEVRTVRWSCADFEEPPPVNRRGDLCFTTMITRLAENAARTAALGREIAALARAGHDVLVLTHRRQHAADLAAATRAAGEADVATYLGGDKAAPDTRVVVATYALTSEGFDMPRLNALVLATPASDVEQSCGRVMRGAAAGGAGARGAVILDWVDRWGVCFAQYAKRRALYRRSGFRMADADAAADADESPTPAATLDMFLDDD